MAKARFLNRFRIRFLIVALLLTVLMVPLAVSAQDSTAAPWTGTYTVQPGDNLFRIALRYNVSTALMAQINGIVNPGWIYAGQVLRVPGHGNPDPLPPPPAPVPGQTQSVSVYAGTTLYEAQTPASPVRAVLPAGTATALGRSPETAWIYLRVTNGSEGWAWANWIIAPATLLNALPVISPHGPVNPDPRSVWVGSSANLYRDPYAFAPAFAVIPAGSTVRLTGRTADSYFVFVQATTFAAEGWAQASAIGVQSNVLYTLPVTYRGTTHPVDGGPVVVGMQAQIVRNGIPLRSAPGGQTSILRYLNGQALVANGRSWDNTWLRVRTNDGAQGWVWLGDTNLSDQSVLTLPQLN